MKSHLCVCGSVTSCMELGRSAKLTVIGFVCNFSNISAIKSAQPMVEMMKAIIQKIRSIQGRDVSPMYLGAEQEEKPIVGESF